MTEGTKNGGSSNAGRKEKLAAKSFRTGKNVRSYGELVGFDIGNIDAKVWAVGGWNEEEGREDA
jgi:hypothetical protein